MEQQSMLGIMAAAAERLSSMHSEASSSPKNHLPPPNAATSSLNNGSSSASHCPSGTVSTSATASSCAPSKRPKLILPELTSDLQDDLESTSGKNANHGNIVTLSAASTSTASSSMKVPLSIAKRPQWADYPLRDIIGPPHPHDVLCGRGGGSNNHPGNESFRELVNEVKVPYVNCPKREKPLIARRIVEAVRNQSPPGRFLQKDMDTGLWNDIGDAKAREKTSQALREGAPIIRDLLHAPSSGSDVATALKEAKRANGQGGASAAAAAAGPEASRHSPKGGNAAAHSSPSAKGKNANAKAQDKMTSMSFPPATDTGGGDASGLSHAHPPPHHGALYPSTSLGQPPIPPLPHVRLISNDDQRRGSLPPTKRFHSLGEVDLPMPPSSIASSSSTAAAMDASQPSSSVPSRWSAHFPPSEQGRHLYRNDNLPPPYRTHSFLQPPTQRALHGGGPQGMSLRGIGGGASLAPPYANMHRRSSDYGMYPPPSSLSHSHPHSLLPPPRYVDSVPIDTVRKLLLGQLDPVQLAMQILPPEDAALVARMRGGDGGALGSGTPSGMMYPTASTSLFSSSPGTSSSLPSDAVDATAGYRTRTPPETAPSRPRPDEFAASDAAHVSDDSTSTGSSGGGGGHSKQHSSSSIGSNSHGGSEAGRDDGSAHSSSNEDVPAGRTASSPPSYDWSDSNGSRSTGVGSASAGRGGSPGKDTGGCGRGSHSKKAHAVLPKKKRKFSG